MVRQLLKSLSICLLLLTPARYSSAQGLFSPYHDAKPKGKIDSVIIISGNADGKNVYIYNKRRQLIETTWYPDGIGRVRDTIKSLCFYDTNGHLISSITFNKGKKNFTRYKYLPRKSGYAIRAIESPQGDSVIFEMRFNHLGQLIQSGNFALNDLERQRLGNIDYKYDEKGNMIKRSAYYNLASGPSKLFYSYNSDGDEVEIIRRAGLDYSRKTTYKYSNYDKMHNWTQRAVDFVNGYEDDDSIHHQDTIRRQIIYYK